MGASPTIERLRRYESQNVTYSAPDGSWPIVWKRARGVHVWDENEKKYLDLTAAFGVAAAGHGNRNVVRAGQRQMAELLHAMGDVHPHAQKADLAQKLSELTFERWDAGTGKTIFTNSGFEAVEAALKTALLVTGRAGVIAFEGAYHGLGYGALNATHRKHFRAPFRAQLNDFATFLEYPQHRDNLSGLEEQLSNHLKSQKFGAILVEPVQARGGIRVPPPEFLQLLRRVCDAHSTLLIVDEIYTGFGRTGRWFACEHSEIAPDLICVGKALTGGFPLSACIGEATLMDRAWPPSSGEAIHTSTFLGHPVGCAMALANISEIEKRNLVNTSAENGLILLRALRALRSDRYHLEVRGLGLMAGIELRRVDGAPATEETLNMIKNLLHAGFIFLPEGQDANIVSFTPPLTISKAGLRASVKALASELNGAAKS